MMSPRKYLDFKRKDKKRKKTTSVKPRVLRSVDTAIVRPSDGNKSEE